MDAFKNAWLAIDTQGKGKISAAELTAYMKKNNYDDAFVAKWLRLFDKDNSGTIEVEEYCDVLGLNFRQLMSEVRTRVSGSSVTSLPAGVVYISGDMSITWQIKIAQLCIETLRSTGAMKDVAKNIKVAADRMFGALWHTVIVNGQFWCFYGHEPGSSFVFRFEKFIFIVWKTPVE